MKKYRVTIYNCMTEKKRRFNIEAWNIGGVYECVQGCRKIHNATEEIIKIERWDNK